jgi:3',5'-nucleoside bisphosphate phosphatase
MKPRTHKTTARVTSSLDRHRIGGADLHVHTTHSDGVCSPCEVVIAAARVGLAALAITDHDNVSALAVARTEAARWGVELIAGVELTCEFEDREIHILGHFIHDDDPKLLDAMAALVAGRTTRLKAMAAQLATLGLSIDVPALKRAFPRAILGRRHLADFLARTGQVKSPREAFARYLGDGCPACAPKPRLDAARAIALIHAAGGVAGLAHPPFNFRESSLRVLVDLGLRAIEVQGPGTSLPLRRRLEAQADRLALVGIGGSDFHAPNGPGRWVGFITTDPDQLQRLRDRRQPRPSEVSEGPPTDRPTDDRRSSVE